MNRRYFMKICMVLSSVVVLSVVSCSRASSSADKENSSAEKNNSNLFVKLEIEKIGLPPETLSSIVSGNSISIHGVLFQEKKENEASSTRPTIFEFSGREIKKLSSERCSMEYDARFVFPVVIKNSEHPLAHSVEYKNAGAISSVNFALGETLCIFDDSVFKVCMTVDKK